MAGARNDTPPIRATKFLRWFCKHEYYEDIQGDLEEEFHYLAADSTIARAKKWYRWQIIKLFKPSMMKKVKGQQELETQNTMFKNHLKIGVRNLWKYKSGTIINTLGLALGLAAFFLIALFVKDELSYDKHHEFANQIHRVTVENFSMDGELSRHWAFASAGHAERLKEDYSAISHAVRFFLWAFPDIDYQEKKLPSQQVVFADDDVFDVFSFPFIQGNKEEAFREVFSLVLTESTAVRIFGEDWEKQNIIGETVKLTAEGNEAPFKVSGVIEDMPQQQHFQFEYLAPMRFLEGFFDEDAMNNVGGNYNWLTYVRLEPGTDVQALEFQSKEFFNKYMGEIRGRDASEFYGFKFQPLLSIHLNSNLEGEIQPNGSLQQVYIFSIVGLLLLLVACVNYMNLATSHFSRRMKEVGVRKVIGAGQSSLLAQFLTESTLITVLSIPLAIGCVYMGLPYINSFMNKELIFSLTSNFELILSVCGLAIGVGLISGLYPALFLSRVKLLKALKGESTIKSSRWNFRNWLVTFQYVVTISLIFALLVIDGQMKFIQSSDPGYTRSQVLDLGLSRKVSNLDRLKRELLEHPNIERGSYSSRIPTGRLADNWGSQFYKADSLVPTDFRMPCIMVDEDFIPTYDITLIAGKNFEEGMDMQKDSTGYYIINRSAAAAMGYPDPVEIIGEKLAYGPYNGKNLGMGRILGVVEDFHFESLHSEIVPMVMLKTNDNLRELSLKIKAEDIQTTLEFIEGVWTQHDAENPARYQFVDELFDQQYQQEERLATMIKVFAVIAIFIGCLGLIGMVGFIIETKTKEIGIRKALGASITNILYIISNQFFILIGLAFLLALPVSYWLMNDWLLGFEYRMTISIVLILMPLFLTCLFTMITLGMQTMKAAMSNPVDSLKDE
ncbi:MAG: FtsX-like permease family protein [Reichenbachiella sp.]|uniref:ABC transporter permease n=1 Tax=Reichenbachiella sp. TaxID=2184521 RepID=UPI0032986F67